MIRPTSKGILQSSCLEQVVISFLEGLLAFLVVLCIWHAKAPRLVDQSYFPHHVIVEPIEGDKESARSRRLTEKPRVSKCVVLQQSVFEGSDPVLLLLVMTVEGTKIQVRRTLELSAV
jgi:hypothetical protein